MQTNTKSYSYIVHAALGKVCIRWEEVQAGTLRIQTQVPFQGATLKAFSPNNGTFPGTDGRGANCGGIITAETAVGLGFHLDGIEAGRPQLQPQPIQLPTLPVVQPATVQAQASTLPVVQAQASTQPVVVSQWEQLVKQQQPAAERLAAVAADQSVKAQALQRLNAALDSGQITAVQFAAAVAACS